LTLIEEPEIELKFHIARPSAVILGVALALLAAACSSSQDSAVTTVAAPAPEAS